MRGIGVAAAVVFLVGGAGAVGAQAADPAACIGLSLEDLLGRYGPPQSVYAARGLEEWQDDVVFSYPWADLYVYRDHVWQAAVQAVFGVRVGDPRAAVLLVLGDEAADYGTDLRYTLEGYAWPMTLRCNLDGEGKVAAIFIYRSDL
jgi:hypothetical protein